MEVSTIGYRLQKKLSHFFRGFAKIARMALSTTKGVLRYHSGSVCTISERLPPVVRNATGGDFGDVHPVLTFSDNVFRIAIVVARP
eukprot:2080577-Rhodomonas_salina.1